MIWRILYKLLGVVAIFSSMSLSLLIAGSTARKQRLLQAHMRALCVLLNVRIHFEGPYAQRPPQLLIANHVSYLDVFVIGSLFPTSFVAKRELANWPFIGPLTRAAETIYVQRNSVASRVAALRSVRNDFHERNVCVFPEGTTTADLEPSRKIWHRGYAYLVPKARSKVYCLGLHYENQESVAWVGEDSLIPHFIRICARRETNAYVFGSLERFQGIESHLEILETSFKAVVQLSKKAHESGSRRNRQGAEASIARQNRTIERLSYENPYDYPPPSTDHGLR